MALGKPNINLKLIHPMTIPVKFGSNWPSGFRGVDLWMKSLRGTPDDRRTDEKWWQKLTLATARWANKGALTSMCTSIQISTLNCAHDSSNFLCNLDIISWILDIYIYGFKFKIRSLITDTGKWKYDLRTSYLNDHVQQPMTTTTKKKDALHQKPVFYFRKTVK